MAGIPLSIMNLVSICGFFASIVSLILSIKVLSRTKNINEYIIRKEKNKTYKVDRLKVIGKLQSLIDSMAYDEVVDTKMKVEILRNITIINEYSEFIDKKCRYYIKEVQRLLQKSTLSGKNEQQIISLLSMIVGKIEVEPIRRNIEDGANEQ